MACKSHSIRRALIAAYTAHFENRCAIYVFIGHVWYLLAIWTSARFEWMPDDPEIVSDILFAIANVLSIARTTYLMPAFEVLGTLQISLGRMLGDITRFLVLFTLVSCDLTVRLRVNFALNCRPSAGHLSTSRTLFKVAAAVARGGIRTPERRDRGLNTPTLFSDDQRRHVIITSTYMCWTWTLLY